MKERAIEALRQLLIRTVLPFRKKREQFLSKFRFSIVFRIGLNYTKLFLIYGILFLIAFIVLFILVEAHSKMKLASAYMEETKKIGALDVSHPDGDFDGLGVTLQIRKIGNGQSVYDNTGEESSRAYLFQWISYIREESHLTLRQSRKLTVGDQKYQFIFYLNLDEVEEQLRHLLIPMLLMMAIMIAVIVHSSEDENHHLLEPIEVMVRTANRLTVNNLNQERLNIEGTKNELKDLAGTINEMLDRLELSYESQKQFVSDASHELRTPIAVIQGYINMLDRWGKRDEEVMEESIEAIKNEAQSMQELVEKLLFLSRHDKKTLKLKKRFFEMSEVVEEMVRETRLVAKNRLVENGPMEEVIVYGDEQSLKQAIRVFIDNAVKYTRDGDSITISCQNDEGDCIIRVADTGLGMVQEDLNHIFERFYRSDQVRNEKISGHGLGLSIARLIIVKHTGRIKVRSQYTVGTTFQITLPRVSY